MRAYLEKLSSLMSFENGVLFYSLWEGYKEKEDMAAFISFIQGKGVKVISLHTSGHADSNTIDALIKKVQPSTIMPVHTENSNWFERYEDITTVKDQAFSF